MSGGQKARVALARAVYRDADVYLLDDPLSAVDAHVGQWLFSECLLKELAGKTRILVTHQVHLLNLCDSVVVLADGRIRAIGSYGELCCLPDFDLAGLIAPRSGPEIEDSAENGDEKEQMETDFESSPDPIHTKQQCDEITNEAAQNFNIIEAEEKNEGIVRPEAYWYYARAGGLLWVALSAFFAIASQVFTLLAAFWLSHWGQVSSDAATRNNTLSAKENLLYLETYAALTMIGVGLLTLRSVSLVELRLNGSLTLHHKLLSAIMVAPIAFFDVTPVGRILNRFSSDILVIDEELSQTINQMINSLMQSLGAIAAVAGATNGTFLILLIPIVVVYSHVQLYFRKSNTAIARLESVSRSPIYADFSQALNGITTIRAYGDEMR